MIPPLYNIKNIFTKLIFSICHFAIFLTVIIPRTGIQGRSVLAIREIRTPKDTRIEADEETRRWKNGKAKDKKDVKIEVEKAS